MVQPRGRDRRSVNNGDQEAEPDAQGPNTEPLRMPGMNDNNKPNEELQNDMLADGNLEQFQRLVLQTSTMTQC